MYIIYIIFNHAFLLFQTTCFEHILLPQLLPDSTHPLHIHSFFLSVSVYCSTWTREAPSFSGKFPIGHLAKNEGPQNAQPWMGCIHHISSRNFLKKRNLLHHYLIYGTEWGIHSSNPDWGLLLIGLPGVLCKHPCELSKHCNSNNTRPVRQLTWYQLQVLLDVVFRKIHP